MLCRKVNDEPLIRLREGVEPHHERVSAVPDCGIKRLLDILGPSHVKELGLDT